MVRIETYFILKGDTSIEDSCIRVQDCSDVSKVNLHKDSKDFDGDLDIQINDNFVIKHSGSWGFRDTILGWENVYSGIIDSSYFKSSVIIDFGEAEEFSFSPRGDNEVEVSVLGDSGVVADRDELLEAFSKAGQIFFSSIKRLNIGDVRDHDSYIEGFKAISPSR